MSRSIGWKAIVASVKFNDYDYSIIPAKPDRLLGPVTIAIVAEHNHNLGPFGPQLSPNGTFHPGTGFPQWFFFLWPVAIAMTVRQQSLPSLFHLTGCKVFMASLTAQ